MVHSEGHLAHVETVQKYYHEAQKYYDVMWGKGLHYGLWTKGVHTRKEAIENENKILSDIAEIAPGDIVLDAGSGIGDSSVWLSQHCKAQVLEFNVTHSQLVRGQKHARGQRVA